MDLSKANFVWFAVWLGLGIAMLAFEPRAPRSVGFWLSGTALFIWTTWRETFTRAIDAKLFAGKNRR